MLAVFANICDLCKGYVIYVLNRLAVQNVYDFILFFLTVPVYLLLNTEKAVHDILMSAISISYGCLQSLQFEVANQLSQQG